MVDEMFGGWVDVRQAIASFTSLVAEDYIYGFVWASIHNGWYGGGRLDAVECHRCTRVYLW